MEQCFLRHYTLGNFKKVISKKLETNEVSPTISPAYYLGRVPSYDKGCRYSQKATESPWVEEMELGIQGDQSG